MTHQYLLAHDLGTTGNKATLFDVDDGVVKVSTFEAYPTDYSQPGWAEQDPADWQRAIWQCTHRLISQSGIEPSAIAAVSFSGHMQGALLVDRQGIPSENASSGLTNAPRPRRISSPQPAAPKHSIDSLGSVSVQLIQPPKYCGSRNIIPRSTNRRTKSCSQKIMRHFCLAAFLPLIILMLQPPCSLT